MNCSDCEPRLIDHASHELAEDERVAVARHLASCSSCALEYCRLQADLQGIADAHAETPRPAVYEALRRRVAQEVAPSWWSRSFTLLFHPVPVYGALLLALIPAALWLAGLRTPGTSAPAAELAPAPIVSTPTLTHYDGTALSFVHEDVL